MERLYPNPKTFVDDSEPDLDAAYFTGLELGVSAIDERLTNILLNSLTATVAGQKALDAVVGKILNDKIEQNARAIAEANSNLSSLEEQNNGDVLLNTDYVTNIGWWNNYYRRGGVASVKTAITAKREIPARTTIATLPFIVFGSFPALDLDGKGYRFICEGNTIITDRVIPANTELSHFFVCVISK